MKLLFEGVVAGVVSSGVCELANQCRLGIQEGVLKQTGAKTERLRQRRGEYSAAAVDVVGKLKKQN